MNIIEVDLDQNRSVKQFLELPFEIYHNTPQWVPPLAMDARQPLNRKKFPFYRENEAVFLLAIQDGACAGRLAVLNNRRFNQFNHTNVAHFYLFECYEDSEISQSLFDYGANWAKTRGLVELYGPKGFSVFDGLGLLVEGFEFRPAFGQPYHLPYYARLIEEAGFHGVGELVTGLMDEHTVFPEKIHQIAELLKKRRGLSIARCESRKDLRIALMRLKNLYNASLSDTQGNVPITEEEADAIFNQMVWFADPHLVKIVMKGDLPVGFLLAYPDISAALQRTRGKLFPFGWLDLLLELRRTKWINVNGAGIIEEYRGLGGTAILFSEMYKSVAGSRYRHADIVQIGTENEKMQREMKSFGIQFHKVHRIYQRAI